MKTMETTKTKHISRRFRRFLPANEAVSALEYAILVGVIAVGIAAALMTFEGNLATAITSIGTDMQTMGATADGTPEPRFQLSNGIEPSPVARRT